MNTRIRRFVQQARLGAVALLGWGLMALAVTARGASPSLMREVSFAEWGKTKSR